MISDPGGELRGEEAVAEDMFSAVCKAGCTGTIEADEMKVHGVLSEEDGMQKMRKG